MKLVQAICDAWPVKVEGPQFETSFMSEPASLFLSSLGLLGEYCPTSRKKNIHPSEIVGCMHLGAIESCRSEVLGCGSMRPFTSEENFAIADKAAVTFCSF